MPLTLPLHDQTSTGASRFAGSVDIESTTTTLRDIIRLRVEQEAARFNATEHIPLGGLAPPEETELLLNGIKPRPTLDSRNQIERAIAGFKSNAFLVLLDDRQILDLDEPLEIAPDSKVAFLRLVPLMGG